MKRHLRPPLFHFVILAVSLPGAAGLFADTLYLKNGTKYENITITGMDRSKLRFTEKGSSRTIAKSNLERIVYSNEADQRAQLKKRDQELAELQEKIRRLADESQGDPASTFGQLRDDIEELKSDLVLIGGIEEPAGDSALADKNAAPPSAENMRIKAQYDKLVAISARVERLEKALQTRRDFDRSTLKANKIESELTGRQLRLLYADAADRQRDAVWRSMLLPGWGHSHTGRPAAGVALGVLFLGGVGLAASQASEVGTLRARYNDPVPFLIARSTGDNTQALLLNAIYYGDIGTRLQAGTARYNAGLALAGAVWAGALFHITLADLTPQVDLSLSTTDPGLAGPGMTISAVLRW